ncbi:ABC transporter permease [Streptomyces sp. NPDC058953]|uniref:ABC transporter permease n=1 Tax=unclassified Streptomyces TaxID=2593676 RepID=UPI0036A9DEC0
MRHGAVAPAGRPCPRTEAARPPGAWRLGLVRGAMEIKVFFRQREQAVFTFAFPVLMLVLFASVFGGDTKEGGITAAQLYVPAMIAAGIMSTSFLSLGVSIAVERELKQLRRLRGTPMPPAAYFLGKIWLVLVTSVLETAALLAVGSLLYDVDPPTEAGRWLTFGWVFLLGLVSCTLLGIAISSVPRSAQSASAVVNLPFQVLQFISGVYVVITSLSDWLLNIAALFPLKWLAQGLRGVFLPESARVLEPAGSWEPGLVALVLGAWCIGGLALCLLTFRRRSRDEG